MIKIGISWSRPKLTFSHRWLGATSGKSSFLLFRCRLSGTDLISWKNDSCSIFSMVWEMANGFWSIFQEHEFFNFFEEIRGWSSMLLPPSELILWFYLIKSFSLSRPSSSNLQIHQFYSILLIFYQKTIFSIFLIFFSKKIIFVSPANKAFLSFFVRIKLERSLHTVWCYFRMINTEYDWWSGREPENQLPQWGLLFRTATTEQILELQAIKVRVFLVL